MKFEFLFVVWIFLLPILFTAGYYEAVKVFWFFLGGIFIVVPLLYKNSSKLKFDTADSLYLAWLFTFLISAFAGLDPIGSIIGGAYRHQGVIFFLLLFFLKKLIQVLDDKTKKYIFYAIFLSVIFEAVFIVFLKMFNLTYLGKPLGTFGDPNACAGFLLVGTLLSQGIFKNKRISSIYAAFISIALISLKTITSYVASLVILVTTFLSYIKSYKLRIFLMLSLVILGSYFIYAFLSTREFSIYENRIQLWYLGLKMFLRRPFLGYGPETTDIIYASAFQEINFRLVNLVYDRSHNLILDMLLWSGVVGAITFFSWLSLEIAELRKTPWKFLTFITWLGFSFYHPLGVVHWVFLIILVAI